MNRCFKEEDSCAVTDRGAWVQIHSHKLFSQSVPTTALRLTTTAGTREAYRLCCQSKKREKRCLVCSKEACQITIRCWLLGIKTDMTLGGFFYMQWQRGKQEQRRAFAMWYGIDCWSQQGWQKDQSWIPVGGLTGAATGDKHRTLPSWLEPRLQYLSGDCRNTKTSVSLRLDRQESHLSDAGRLWAELMNSCQVYWGWIRGWHIIHSTGSCPPCSFSCVTKPLGLRAAKPASQGAEEREGLSHRWDPHHLAASCRA